MYVQIISVNDKKRHVVNVSKNMAIKEFKLIVSQLFEIELDKQRLFFRGKQLENGYSLFNYNVNLNDVIHLMIKESVSDIVNSPVKVDAVRDVVVQDADLADNYQENKENQMISKYYKVGDIVEAIEPIHGSWLEAEITSITLNSNYVKNTTNFCDDDCVYTVKFLNYLFENNVQISLPLEAIRPISFQRCSIKDVKIGDKLLVNYNIKEPKKRGYWYDCIVKRIPSQTDLVGCIFVGVEETMINNCKIIYVDELMKIETHRLLSDTKQDRSVIDDIIFRVTFDNCCKTCGDSALKKKCKECGCQKCHLKDDPSKQIVCDECNQPFHLWCLQPKLDAIPNSDWYCENCRIDDNEIVKAGDKLKESKRKSKLPSAQSVCTRDWGKGMACVGRTKECSIVPSNHFGPIPGVEVGTLWKFRIQVSECGIHRAVVAGICGRSTEGAYSLVLSGGYEDDIDNGDEFIYTGSGGRDLSGNKRHSKQSCDQELTRFNRALALNCNAQFNECGAVAKDWKGGAPVRVVRNYKLRKHSKYAPEEGNRYDGLYKVVSYYPEKGKSGFLVWRYVLRRDDPTPAPWTKQGKKRIKSLGLKMSYPEGYLEAQMAKNKLPRKRTRTNKFSDEEDENTVPTKKIRYVLEPDYLELINKDVLNRRSWDECKNFQSSSKKEFLDHVEEMFKCVCCQDLLFNPVTLQCSHNICKQCLKQSFRASTFSCPHCRFELGENYNMEVNKNLSVILLELFPGYAVGRA